MRSIKFGFPAVFVATLVLVYYLGFWATMKAMLWSGILALLSVVWAFWLSLNVTTFFHTNNLFIFVCMLDRGKGINVVLRIAR